MSRPELQGPPELVYNAEESRKYTFNSHISQIQGEMSERAVDLLALDGPSMVLDIGCGSGLSLDAVTDRGHECIGIDISKDMLQISQEREVEGDVMQMDIGDGIPFRAGAFDGAISISVVQWLLNASTSDQNPHKRLARFFNSLYSCLKRNARAVLQIYPSCKQQLDLITKAALKSGFSGGLVIDFPDTNRQKYYLCLCAGGTLPNQQPLSANDTRKTKAKKQKCGKDYVMRKKELMRKRGRTDVPTDSKYTGRKRRDRF